MLIEKPKKILYKNQEEIPPQFKKFILPWISKFPKIKEARIWGSLANGKFGIYDNNYRGHTGSDIDLVLLLEKYTRIPSRWTDMKCDKSWFKGYIDKQENKKFRHFPYRDNIHRIDLLVVKRPKLKIAKKRLLGTSKKIYLKLGSEEELK